MFESASTGSAFLPEINIIIIYYINDVCDEI